MKKQYTVAPVIKNEKITVTFEDLTSEGMGVAKVEGYPLFVADGLPGERATIKVTKVGKSFGFARIEERLSSSYRISICDVKKEHASGTMPLQNLRYSAQLAFKKNNNVEQVMKRIAKTPEVEVKPTIGMENPWDPEQSTDSGTSKRRQIGYRILPQPT